MSDDKQALSSSGVVVGENVSSRIQAVMKRMAAEQDALELEQRKAADRTQYDSPTELWCFVKTTTSANGTPWFTAETTSPVPGIGAHVKTDKHERTARLALAELRFKIAKLWAAKPNADFEVCRQKAAKLVLRQALIDSADTAGS